MQMTVSDKVSFLREIQTQGKAKAEGLALEGGNANDFRMASYAYPGTYVVPGTRYLVHKEGTP